jgi:hypothetical protein
VGGRRQLQLGALVWQRADTVIWLDPPRYRVMRRIISRTARRAISGAELWNGNREHWTSFFRVDPDKSIIAWAWTRDRVVRERYSSAQADPANAHLTVIRVCSDPDVAALTDPGGAYPGPAPLRRPARPPRQP